MPKKLFQLNCDMGEGIGNDHLIMPWIDACSIACGGHAGDEQTMRNTVKLAMEHKVEIGAHPSFPDKENFGRKAMDISAGELISSLKHQVESLFKICEKYKAQPGHIKLHGALYNMAAADSNLSDLVLEALTDYRHLPFLAPLNSAFFKQCELHNVPVRPEAFADRVYDNQGKLLERNLPDSVILDKTQALEQLLSIINKGTLSFVDGKTIAIRADTFCVHGDNPKALEILQTLKMHQFEA
ncbi:5-oxoprolinase subunit PxpA [Marinoscillum sp. MHG1-6]|uniref:5-oxoprolinase subunit PxpA n=1 Tax=Marinoscillum sp. MHG1-6 TaxID=2959627 RepID=UPI0021588E7E|nr:5-oxoprolinase subunit PxpA [Marinoscillum sp. MHG1-6]